MHLCLGIIKLSIKDPHAEGAANMIRGMATYISDTADIQTYVKTSQRTGIKQRISLLILVLDFLVRNHLKISFGF